MNHIFFDVEADNLLYEATQIWCIVGWEEETNLYHIFHQPLDTGEKLQYNKDYIIYNNILEYLYYLSSCYLLGHNILGYDLPLLNKLYNYSYTTTIDTICDTIVMSRLSYPDRPGHSLEYWGEVFKYPKDTFDDFSRVSIELIERCITDVNITRRVYLQLQEEMKGWNWNMSLSIEYAMQHIQTKQEMNGVLFHKEGAENLLGVIKKEIEEIEEIVLSSIPLKVVDMGNIDKPFLKSGGYSKQSERWISEF